MGKSKGEKKEAKDAVVHRVVEGVVKVKKGASEKAAEIASIAAGQCFAVTAEKPSWQKVDGGGMDGWVNVTLDGAAVEVCTDLTVTDAISNTQHTWNEWLAHKKTKAHSKQFAYNLYNPNDVPNIGFANQLIEKAALLNNPELLAVLKANVALPAENCGRWGGPRPTAKKEKAEPKAADDEADPTEAELAWAAKAEARRKQVTDAAAAYNTGDIPVAMSSYPGAVEPFPAGRGRPLTPPKPM